MANGEVIFLQTDPTFNLPLLAVSELNRQRRLNIRSVQEARIENIRSQDPNPAEDTIFGKTRCNDERVARQSFARAFAPVARACMCRATNMPIESWTDDPAFSRNRQIIDQSYTQQHGQLFSILATGGRAVAYTSKYDQLYPHFMIEEKLAAVGVGRRAEFNSMVLIFRRNFREIVQISTTANATSRHNVQPGMFESFISVQCFHATVDDERGQDERYMELLREFCGDPGVDNYLDGINRHIASLTVHDDDNDEDSSDGEENH